MFAVLSTYHPSTPPSLLDQYWTCANRIFLHTGLRYKSSC